MDWFLRERAEQHSELRLRTPDGEEKVRAMDIRYIETRGHTCVIHTTEQTEKAMTPHSSTLAWKIPWTEGPGGLQSMGSLRVGHD